MKKRSAKKAAKGTEPRLGEAIDPPVSVPLRAPTTPGTPLRIEEFPPLDEVARLSCLLANGTLPSSSDAARRLAASALEIWKGCRDELMSSRDLSATYWKSRDESANRLSESFAEVNRFLSENEGSHLIGANRVSWEEVLAVLAVATSKGFAKAELERTVSEKLVGQSPWGEWTLDDFKTYGFDSWSFPSLILVVTEDRERSRTEARSKEMRKKAQLSVEVRKRKREIDKWGSLVPGEEIREYPKKAT